MTYIIMSMSVKEDGEKIAKRKRDYATKWERTEEIRRQTDGDTRDTAIKRKREIERDRVRER